MKYKLILADPPWQYNNANLNGCAEAHYDTTKTEDLATMPVPEIADPAGCVLLMWVTGPMVPDALRLFDQWGFSYKTKLVWFKAADDGMDLRKAKPDYGTGFWVRGNPEDVWIGTKGNVKVPRQPALAIISNIFRHSRKPECLHEYGEALGLTPRCELFARAGRPGWDSFGNQTESSQHLTDLFLPWLPLAENKRRSFHASKNQHEQTSLFGK